LLFSGDFHLEYARNQVWRCLVLVDHSWTLCLVTAHVPAHVTRRHFSNSAHSLHFLWAKHTVGLTGDLLNGSAHHLWSMKHIPTHPHASCTMIKLWISHMQILYIMHIESLHNAYVNFYLFDYVMEPWISSSIHRVFANC
jgi:hypothetical protein